MSPFDKVVSGLTESLGEVALALTSEVRVPSKPKLFLLTSFTATALASNYLSAALAVLPFSILALRDRAARKVLIYVTSFSLVVALPLLVAGRVSAGGFVVRVFSSSGFFVYMVRLTGWEGIVKALGEAGLPEELALSLRLLPYQLYVALKDLNSLVLARRARTFSSRTRDVWWALSTAVGSLLLKGIRRAGTVSLALKARGLSSYSYKRYSLPTALSTIACGVSVVAVLAGSLVQLR